MNKALLSSNCDEWETPPDPRGRRGNGPAEIRGRDRRGEMLGRPVDADRPGVHL